MAVSSRSLFQASCKHPSNSLSLPLNVFHNLSNSLIFNLPAQLILFIIRVVRERLQSALLLVALVQVLSDAEEEPREEDECDVDGVALEPSWTCRVLSVSGCDSSGGRAYLQQREIRRWGRRRRLPIRTSTSEIVSGLWFGSTGSGG